ncbi:MAG: prephenate dehydrogenase/arogenate dehydrogenase family protein [Burkholderiales bacterium]|jgi:prephenate dehydrogenase|nr:prephenate dehydrogenase/arogenate dehydrogenase family protein [Burkholderiales bacterium]
MNFGKLVIFGVGLIGGSVALALKGKNAVTEVVGIGRTKANLQSALTLNVIDRAATLDEDWARELANANIVLIAAPVAQTHALLSRILPVLNPTAILTDAGSTKEDVIVAAKKAYGLTPRVSLSQFVPAHPIAGTEHSGAAAAFATLYQGKKTIITPIEETHPKAVDVVTSLWETCGSTVYTLPYKTHDAIFAAVSHLPHMVGFAYVAGLASRDNAAQLFDFTGGGFKDFTRIAASSPEMWRDIALSNKNALTDEINALIQNLDELKKEIADDAGDALLSRFSVAARARQALK